MSIIFIDTSRIYLFKNVIIFIHSFIDVRFYNS